MTGVDDLRWANDNLASAEEMLEYGRQAFGSRRYASAMAFAADSIEYSLKAALHAVRVVPNEDHTEPGQLYGVRALFPKEWRGRMEEWVEIGEEARKRRMKAKYGDTRLGRLRGDVFKEPGPVETMLSDAGKVHAQVGDFVASRRIG